MNALFTAKAWLEHLWHGKLPRSLHSPFLFRLFMACRPDKQALDSFDTIEKQRNRLLHSHEMIHRKDFGAGSKGKSSKPQQSVQSIARHALSNKKQCQFMASLVRFLNPSHILELGTSLGIMSAYLKTADPVSTVTTVEGDPALNKIAKEVWQELNLSVNGVTSTFETFFETREFSQTAWDLVFIDGNHRASALQSYFDQLLPVTHPDTVIIVDDIYWSADMRAGWQQLINHPAVTQSVDCFRFGMLFFKPGFLAKEHHRIILL